MMELDLDLKVLVVEDTESMRRIVRSVLKGFGFKDIQEAPNGKEGLDRLRTGDYGLVIAVERGQVLAGHFMLKRALHPTGLALFRTVLAEAPKFPSLF